MRISIHQPAYLPWLGYMEKMKNCDVFVYLDTVAYSKNSFDNRNRIVVDGADKWLTIPIATAGRSGQMYIETYPVRYDWMLDHIKTIKHAYKTSKNYGVYYPILEDVYRDAYAVSSGESIRAYDGHFGPSLADVNWFFLKFFEDAFATTCKVVRSNTRKFVGKSSDLILDICAKMGATEYYSGAMGRDYLDEPSFEKAGIKIIYQEYKPPNYYSALHQLFTIGPLL